MSERVTMPALGESVTEGTVTRWLKNVGETIEIDEPLLEVSTDKVDTEIPSPVSGTVLEILAAEDDTVPVGADLAVIGDPADQNGGAPTPGPTAEPAAESVPEPAAESVPEPAASASSDQLPPPAEAPSTAIEPDEEAKAPRASTGSTDSGGTTITMPALGESVTEGTVTRWLKAEGDQVETDEALLEVSTDKVDTEIPSPVSGTLTKILVAEDETVPVGADLAVIGGQPTESSQPPSTPEPVAASSSAPTGDAPAAEPAEEPAAPHPAAETAEEPAEAAIRAASNDPSLASADVSEPTEFPQSNATELTASDQSAPGQKGAEAAAYVTPLVRKLAAQHEVDLATLSGTGVGGRIRKQDVLDAAQAATDKAAADKAAADKAAAESAAAPQAAPAAPSGPTSGASPAAGTAVTQPVAVTVSPKRGTTEKMSRLRKVIAQRMVESLQVSAQLTTVVEVDVTRIARLRDRAKRDFEVREGVKLSYLPFFALAAVEALKQHPTVNASVDGDQITYHGAEHLGVAVDTERGLLVPVIRDAGDLNIAGLSRKIADLAARTRGNKITPDELGGGTFTLTNTGSRGALFDTPIINQPQVAILGTGSVVKRPVVVADQDGGETIAIRSMIYLALSYDHRIVDGADGARFLSTMKTRLEEGAFEASLGL